MTASLSSIFWMYDDCHPADRPKVATFSMLSRSAIFLFPAPYSVISKIRRITVARSSFTRNSSAFLSRLNHAGHWEVSL